MKLRTGLLLVLVTSLVLLAADAPYAGTWKMNLTKSQLSGTSVTYQKLASDEWQATADGVTYKFKMDGKEYPDNLGDTAAWKSVDATTWQTAWKSNGKPMGVDTLRVGADGILTVTTKGTKPNGEAIDNTATFQRISGGPGLAGKWRSKSVQSSSPDVMQLVESAGNGIAYKVPAYGLSCEGKLDGKDYPCAGDATPPGWTAAFTKTGTNSISAVVKKDGKPLYRYAYMPSADGKMLIVTGGAVATNEKVKMVYDRR